MNLQDDPIVEMIFDAEGLSPQQREEKIRLTEQFLAEKRRRRMELMILKKLKWQEVGF